MRDFPGALVQASIDIGDVNIPALQQLLKQHGLVLIRGHSINVESFKSFSDLFCREFVPHLNLQREFLGDQTMMLVSPGSDHFFAHAEMAYSPMRPEVAFFFCVQPAATGGETTICDGIEVLKRLNPKTRQVFEKNSLLYEDKCPYSAWKGIATNPDDLRNILDRFAPLGFEYRLDDQILTSRYVTSAIVKTNWSPEYAFANSLLDSKAPKFADGSLIPKPLLWDVISATEDLMYPVAWQQGDLLLVDNSRFMHGRRAWTDPKRKIIVRFGNL